MWPNYWTVATIFVLMSAETSIMSYCALETRNDELCVEQRSKQADAVKVVVASDDHVLWLLSLQHGQSMPVF
jgi:hypothetical protein